MFGPPGTAYVYLVYGMYDCLNVVTERDGRAGAVLIRAVEPMSGVAAMRAALAGLRAERRRGPVRDARPRPVPELRLTAGPGLVAAAFSVDRTCTGQDLCDPASPLHLEVSPPGTRQVSILASPRIGVAYAGEPWATAPFRLIDASSPSVRRASRGSGTARTG